MRSEIFGYQIEQVSSEPNRVNYHLIGPKVTYRLVRRNDGRTLYALNTRGNICAIKGNYNFSDASGELHPVY